MEETSQKEIIVEHAKPVLRKPPDEDPDLPEPQVDASKVVIKEQKPPTPSVEVEIANFKHNSDAAEPITPKKGFVRPRSQITKCEHVDAVYYAQGLCRNCYHSKGRSKLATECEHTERKLYARGVCKACYLRMFQYRKSQSKKKATDKQKVTKNPN